jgi:hypothetical protein
MWVEFLLKEITASSNSIPILWCDNIGATFLAANPQFHARTKQIDIDFHFVKKRVVSNTLRVQFISSNDQLADLLIKSLPLPRFEKLRTKLNVVPMTSA